MSIRVNGVLYVDELHYKYVEGHWPRDYEIVNEPKAETPALREKRILLIDGEVYESVFEYWYKKGFRPKEIQYLSESELANVGRRK